MSKQELRLAFAAIASWVLVYLTFRYAYPHYGYGPGVLPQSAGQWGHFFQWLVIPPGVAAAIFAFFRIAQRWPVVRVGQESGSPESITSEEPAFRRADASVYRDGPEGWRQLIADAGEHGWTAVSGFTGVTFSRRGRAFKAHSIKEAVTYFQGKA